MGLPCLNMSAQKRTACKRFNVRSRSSEACSIITSMSACAPRDTSRHGSAKQDLRFQKSVGDARADRRGTIGSELSSDSYNRGHCVKLPNVQPVDLALQGRLRNDGNKDDVKNRLWCSNQGRLEACCCARGNQSGCTGSTHACEAARHMVRN